jgi:hypothetical protein
MSAQTDTDTDTHTERGFMMHVRCSADRGHTRLAWLDSRHTFSFADYRDPKHMGFRALRVVNDDVIAPAHGFGMHPHRDMEILTFVRWGRLEHGDSMGHGAIIGPEAVQRMTAGTGVVHRELNPSDHEATRLLQVWITPDKLGLAPEYEQRAFSDDWQLVATPDGRDGTLTVHQDVRIYRGRLQPGESVHCALQPQRHAWVQVSDGNARIAGETLLAGDGAALCDAREITIEALTPTEILLFDLA